jgi:hypothetical protein
LALAALLILPAPALAQSDSEELDRRVAERLEQAKAVTGVPERRNRCRPSSGDEIVVCVDNGGDQRVPSTAETDPSSLAARRMLNNGVPRAPQFDRGSCRGQPGCITGGWAPPPVYYVDVTKLPEAPEGSEADRIAKGEAAEP